MNNSADKLCKLEGPLLDASDIGLKLIFHG